MKDENEAKNGSRCRLAPSATGCPRVPPFYADPQHLHPSSFVLHLLLPRLHFKERREGGVNAEFRRAVDQKPSARMPVLNGRRPTVGEHPGFESCGCWEREQSREHAADVLFPRRGKQQLGCMVVGGAQRNGSQFFTPVRPGTPHGKTPAYNRARSPSGWSRRAAGRGRGCSSRRTARNIARG